MEKTTHLSNTDGEMLLRIAKSFVGPLVPKGVIPKHEADDIEQKIVIDVITHYHLFDPAVTSLSTFAHMRMETALKKILRDLGKKGDFLRTAVSLNEMVESDDDDETERIELIISTGELANPQNIERENRRNTLIRDVRSFISTLSPLEQKVCFALMENSHRDAAERVGITYSKLRIVMQKLKVKMKAAGFEGF